MCLLKIGRPKDAFSYASEAQKVEPSSLSDTLTLCAQLYSESELQKDESLSIVCEDLHSQFKTQF